MNELKSTLKRVAVYYVLLAVSIIPCGSVIPDVFPTRNVSTAYLLTLSVCLVLYCSYRVLPTGALSVMIKAIAWTALLMILLRGVKYSAFSEVGALARHTWYLYYVPILLLPLFLFYISLLIAPKNAARVSAIRYLTLALTVVLIVIVLTNDLHQLVFGFKPGFADWNGDYSYGKLFYAVIVWQYALYVTAITILIIKCRVVGAKKNAWLILIPFLTGVLLNLLLLTGKMPRLHGSYIIEFPEALIFTVAAVLECCIGLGLIPTNTDYGKLFRKFSLSAQITDERGTPVYVSSGAAPLTAEQFAAQDGARIAEHTVLHKMSIPGGFGFWQDDMTGLDRLNEELTDAKEELSQEAELTRLKSELKEKQTKTEQRTLVYDEIARHTQKQSQQISDLAKRARLSPDAALKDDLRRRIILLGAYIKRYANLMLLSRERGAIDAGELGLSISEVLRHLNFCGIPGEFIQSSDGTVSTDAALAAFEAFETLLEANLTCLKGVFVNLSVNENALLKMTFEGLIKPLSEDTAKRLLTHKVKCETTREDDVTYVFFTLPKASDAV
ncbi:MAG: hypothetical protein IJS65_07650 [Clostridia bacterium]|nr:hypothetical protein [Clostridia bacterium]